jgi:hypothetical protein
MHGDEFRVFVELVWVVIKKKLMFYSMDRKELWYHVGRFQDVEKDSLFPLLFKVLYNTSKL